MTGSALATLRDDPETRTRYIVPLVGGGRAETVKEIRDEWARLVVADPDVPRFIIETGKMQGDTFLMLCSVTGGESLFHQLFNTDGGKALCNLAVHPPTVSRDAGRSAAD